MGYVPATDGFAALSQSGLTRFMRTYPTDRAVMKAVCDFIKLHLWEGCWFLTTNDEFGVDAAR